METDPVLKKIGGVAEAEVFFKMTPGEIRVRDGLGLRKAWVRASSEDCGSAAKRGFGVLRPSRRAKGAAAGPSRLPSVFLEGKADKRTGATTTSGMNLPNGG